MLCNLRNPTGRLARWSPDLLEYDFEIVHRKGEHHVMDALSRFYEDEEHLYLDMMEPVEDEWYARRRQAILDFPHKFQGWKVVEGRLYRYRHNPILEDILDDLDAWKLVVTRDQIEAVILEVRENPEAGHLGVEKTHYRGKTQYYWPGMFKDINNFIRKCAVYELMKSEQAGPKSLMGHRLVQEPWTVVATGDKGPYPRSRRGNEYLVVYQDLFTK